MGKSIFIEPIKRWLQRNLIRGRPSRETATDDPIAYIRDIFDLTDVSVEMSLASSEVPDGELNRLAPDVVENVFESKAPQSRKAVPIEREEPEESLPVSRPISKVGADAMPENENVEASQGQQPVVRPISSEVPQDSAREAVGDGAVEESDDGVEPQEELSNLVDELLTPEATDTGDALGFLAGDLKSIFKRKVSANPHTKRLIEKHGTVDAHELVNDLRNLVRRMEEGDPRQ